MKVREYDPGIPQIIGVAPITQLRTSVIKEVTIDGVHVTYVVKVSFHTIRNCS